MAANTVVPPPPRVTGDLATDNYALNQWIWQFYTATVVESGLLDPNFQATAAASVDPANLPDPTNTSIAKAQQTANAAITALAAHGIFP